MSKHLHFIFFGDSICFGQGVSINRVWVPRIASKLCDNEAIEQAIRTTSTAINGRTTRQALENMPHEVQSQSPDLLLVQFGMNDCNYWETDKGLPRVSPNAFKANLLEIVMRGKRFGASKIILNTNHPTLRTTLQFPGTSITYNESNLVYNNLIREVAAMDDDIVLNDIEKAFAERGITYANLSEYLLSDHLHLSEKGHDTYYDITLPIVQDIIKKIKQY